MLSCVIRSFKDHETEKLFRRERSRAVPAALHRVALRKLVQIDQRIPSTT